MEINLIDVHCHIDPLCIGLWICCCHIVAPLCKFSWLQRDRVMEVWIHIVFFVAISLVSDFMDLYCIGRQLWFKLVYLSMGMPTLGVIYI